MPNNMNNQNFVASFGGSEDIYSGPSRGFQRVFSCYQPQGNYNSSGHQWRQERYHHQPQQLSLSNSAPLLFTPSGRVLIYRQQPFYPSMMECMAMQDNQRASSCPPSTGDFHSTIFPTSGSSVFSLNQDHSQQDPVQPVAYVNSLPQGLSLSEGPAGSRFWGPEETGERLAQSLNLLHVDVRQACLQAGQPGIGHAVSTVEWVRRPDRASSAPPQVPIFECSQPAPIYSIPVLPQSFIPPSPPMPYSNSLSGSFVPPPPPMPYLNPPIASYPTYPTPQTQQSFLIYPAPLPQPIAPTPLSCHPTPQHYQPPLQQNFEEQESDGDTVYDTDDEPKKKYQWSLRGPPQITEHVKFSFKREICGSDSAAINPKQLFMRFIEVTPLLQTGPTCGLLALTLIANLIRPHDVASEILPLGRSLGMTRQGEMFNARNMAVLAETILGNVCDISVLTGCPLSTMADEIIEDLLHHTMMLVPYDNGWDNSPGNYRGSKAHWCLVVGLAQSSDTRYLAACHGKSRNIAFWRYDVLASSNQQLMQPGSKLNVNDYVIGDLTNELCGQVVRLKFKPGISVPVAYADAHSLDAYFDYLRSVSNFTANN